MDKDTLLDINGLTIGHKDNVLYSNVSFDINSGDCIMLCGANGSGKTTLLKTLSSMSDDVSLVPSRTPKVPGFTLLEFIRLACHRKPSHIIKEDALTALKSIGISHLADRDISTLSDGEFQKGCIAAGLANNSHIILLDEPTAFLDVESRIMVLETLSNICKTGSRAVIFSTHDIHEALSVSNKIIALGADGIFRCSETSLKETATTIFTRR